MKSKGSNLQLKIIERLKKVFYLINQKGETTMIDNYSDLIDKSKRGLLKPEDFSKTHFHNPLAVKHNQNDQKENAMDKANTIFIES